MSWLPAVVQSRIDEGRRRLEDLEHAATEEVHEAREQATSSVKALRGEASATLETGASYAQDVADFAKNAPVAATRSAGGLATKATAHFPKPAVPVAKADFSFYTDEALDHAVTAQQMRVDGMPAGAERDLAQRELRAMQGEARTRAERPEDAYPEL